MRYRTIVADPPWEYGALPTTRIPKGVIHDGRKPARPFSMMTVGEITNLPVKEMADRNAHLYLWTTNRYLPEAFSVIEAWGFRYSQTLTWCKKPKGLGPGPSYASTTEFCLVGKRGSLTVRRRWDTSWFALPRQARHSQKPEAFLDIVEQVSPGPYLEMFARRARFGWNYWGDESLQTVDLDAA